MANLVKFLMIVTNVCFWAMGATMFGITIWMAVDSSVQAMSTITGAAGMNKDIYWAAVYLMMTMGIFVIFAGLIGCMGAVKVPDSDRILQAYFGLVKFIIIIEIVIIILAAVYWGELNDGVRDSMVEQVEKEYNISSSLTKAWNNMQENWKCCGSYNYTDYENSYYTQTTTLRVPQTCCLKADKNFLPCQSSSDIVDNIQSAGCFDKLKNVVKDNSTIIIIITCIFAGLELVGSILACMLLRKK